MGLHNRLSTIWFWYILLSRLALIPIPIQFHSTWPKEWIANNKKLALNRLIEKGIRFLILNSNSVLFAFKFIVLLHRRAVWFKFDEWRGQHSTKPLTTFSLSIYIIQMYLVCMRTHWRMDPKMEGYSCLLHFKCLNVQCR